MTDGDALGLVGTTIAEKYAVESVVGEGGFAVVYRATHLVWKRPVAVKVFKALGDVAERERGRLLEEFLQEGRLLAELSERSAAIVQARDVGMMTAPGGMQVPYMVLEWLEGRSLESVIEDERRAGLPLRTLEEAIALVAPAAEALALAHARGVAHRDVKPANIFLLGDPRGEHSVKLLDFGIAKVVQDAQKLSFAKTSGIITSFTPAYGAPEQFNRAYGATGPWTDVFALTLVVVELLVGREALSGNTLAELGSMSSDPTSRPTPGRYGAAIGAEAEAVFEKALAVSVAARYQTVGELWSALRAVATSGSAFVRTGPPSADAAVSAVAPTIAAPVPVTTTVKRTSGTLAAAGLAAVVLVVAFGAWVAKARRPSVATPDASAPAVSGAPDCPPGMKRIPGGEFFMGADEVEAKDDEKPPHRVRLEPYCLDAHEVTVARYKECSDHGGCLRAGRQNIWEKISDEERKVYDPLCNANDAADRLQHPVNCIGWEQARAFCEASGGRLPTEAEWEFAARGSDGRVYPWGDAPPDGTLLNACGPECVAWMKLHPDPAVTPEAMYATDDGFPNTAPVGSFPRGASQYGILDLTGNVLEWVADWHAPYDAASARTVTPAPKGPATGTTRVVRGGAWNASQPAWARPSWRFSVAPESRTHGIGFRCARSL